MSGSSMQLPEFGDTFCDGLISGIDFGPRREFVLYVTPLVWDGHRGRHGSELQVRFGSISNLPEIQAGFSAAATRDSEIGSVSYAAEPVSRPGNAVVRVTFERSDQVIVIRCGNVTISPSVRPTPDAE